jgi:rod shape determining protein RodA
MVFVSLVDYNWIFRFYWLLYVLNLVLLVYVRVAGKSSKGAARWIRVTDSLNIQPSEFAKIFIIIFTAKLIAMFRERFNTWRFLGILAILLAIPVLLIFMQPDLSTTLLVSMVLCAVIFCAGIDYRKLGIVIAVLVPLAGAFFIYIQTPNQKLLQTYQVERIMSHFNQDADENADDLYQQENSVRAIGSGQLMGKGLNNDDPNSVKNAGLIPEAQTDFIFSVIGEELGFIGSLVTLFLLSWIVVECVLAALGARNLEGRLACCGIACWVAFQSFINLGVTTLILPNTGLPLPFISYGLSSLLSLSIAMGLVINVSSSRYFVDDEAVLDFKQSAGFRV